MTGRGGAPPSRTAAPVNQRKTFVAEANNARSKDARTLQSDGFGRIGPGRQHAETVAPKAHAPSVAPKARAAALIKSAIKRPQRPGIRPDGIGRSGSLIASTCRSHQSFAAWLIPQTTGPARIIPATTRPGEDVKGTPDATAPQRNAQTGGNHVIGFTSVMTADGDGYRGAGVNISLTLIVST